MPRLGLALPSRPASWAALVALAREAEALGLASLWLPDPPPGDQDALDPLTALAGLARATTAIRLGTLALDAGRRPPGVLAKALATVDRLSGGRLTVGLAPADATGEAVEQLAEVVAVLRAAFAGGPVDHTGRFHRLEGLRVEPGPLQRPRPPLWVVGDGDGVRSLAVAAADGWHPGTWRPGPLPSGAGDGGLAGACRAAGRDPATLDVAAGWVATGGRRELSAAVAAWAAAGVDDLVASPGALPFGETTTGDLRRMASAIE
ncbi:MAG TPA: LLM class flavin-dependent oxidoreductase [Acidimicrobiales bacterium]|nr:LLM class flavin-dependent oxidoreductase [Acidimicrobiales bacterium]